MNTTRKLFVNLPVADLPRAMEFFAKLGFEYDKRLTDEKAACMVIGPDTNFMLLRREFFQGFTKKQICDTRTHTEGLFAISCDSRTAVDAIADKALGAGGKPASDPQDHGFMYVRSFYDLDGHHWEAAWMDASAFA